jgi:hypothetical protein
MRQFPNALLLALLITSMALWIRSYSRFDAISALGFGILSESGEVYVVKLQMSDGSGYVNGKAGKRGRFEVEMGLKNRPWLPIRTWTSGGRRSVSVQSWATTGAIATLLWWRWRRRTKTEAPGFAVVTREAS